MHNGYGQVTLVTTLLRTVGTKVPACAKVSACAKASARRTAGVPVAAGATTEGVSGATTEAAGNLRQPAGRRADAHQARRRAASDAQYVRMMLAPARRIAVSVSMITLSRSSQPLAAAASAIAYSPLTW